jgi:uncharacterized protein (DUF1697 family)
LSKSKQLAAQTHELHDCFLVTTAKRATTGRAMTAQMTAYVALLRAVNVGGTGKLEMAKLTAICIEAGFTAVKTYIASGNVVFKSAARPVKVKAELEARLAAYANKPVGVVVRTAAEMAQIAKANPFPEAAPNQTVAIFLDAAPPADALAHAVGRSSEEMRAGEREIYVHYPDGMARTKLRIPTAKDGTARNMNTVAKLAEMAANL